MKIKKLTLEYHRKNAALNLPDFYVVVRSEHTTEYNPGDALSKADVDALNLSHHWATAVVAKK